jgi:hypothetical protein
MEPPVSNAPINAKTALPPTVHALPVLTLSTETSLKTANALRDTMIQAQLTAHLARLPAILAIMPLPALHVIQPSSETLLALSALAWTDTMSYITLTWLVPVTFVTLNVLPVSLHLLNALLAIPIKTESLELEAMESKHVSVIQAITQLLMDHASNPTAMLILIALNVLKDLTFAFSVLPLWTECSNNPLASVSVLTDTMPMPTTVVLLVLQDALSALQLQTVLLVPPLPLHQEADHVLVQIKHILPFLLMEFVTVLHVDQTA